MTKSDPCGCHPTLADHNAHIEQVDSYEYVSPPESSLAFSMDTIESEGLEFGYCHDCGFDFLPLMLLLPLFGVVTAFLLRFRRHTNYVTFRRMLPHAYNHSHNLDCLWMLKARFHFRNIRELSTKSRCAYCHDVIGQAHTIWKCPSCDTPHHPDCYLNHTGCSVFGCRSAGTLRPL
jgi:hypothetical protein